MSSGPLDHGEQPARAGRNSRDSKWTVPPCRGGRGEGGGGGKMRDMDLRPDVSQAALGTQVLRQKPHSPLRTIEVCAGSMYVAYSLLY